jgi:hypothetical protein
MSRIPFAFDLEPDAGSGHWALSGKAWEVGSRKPGNLFDGRFTSNPSAGRGGLSRHVHRPQPFPKRLGFFFTAESAETAEKN